MSSPSQKPTKAEVQALVKPIDDAIEGLAKSQIRLLLVSLILAEEVKINFKEVGEKLGCKESSTRVIFNKARRQLNLGLKGLAKKDDPATKAEDAEDDAEDEDGRASI